MHTYRDALERVGSVRVLYPGSIDEWYPVGPHHGARQGPDRHRPEHEKGHDGGQNDERPLLHPVERAYFTRR